jgi:hypothetical protein
MMEKPPPRHPPIPDGEPASGPARQEDELEPATTEEDEVPKDPYDDLWDPDMDIRPERIKRTKARPKMDSRSRGRSSSRGRRREEV